MTQLQKPSYETWMHCSCRYCFLGQTVADVSIEGSPGSNTHGLQHLQAQASLETSDFLGLRVHKLGGVMSKIIEGV